MSDLMRSEHRSSLRRLLTHSGPKGDAVLDQKRTLPQLRDALLRAEHPSRYIQLADQYMRQIELVGDDFILPAAHADLATLLNYYKDDLGGWEKFVRNVRDRMPRSQERRKVQEIYRIVQMRRIQREARERTGRAVAKALELGRVEDVYELKLLYARKCAQSWLKQKHAMLKEHRVRTKRNRLSVEERSELLEKFWAEIDQDIAAGILP